MATHGEGSEASKHRRDPDTTSLRLRKAMDGDSGSLEWVVKRFSPLLLSHAGLLLGRKLRRLYDPDDLVADVWAVALPRIKGLPPRSGRLTPVLMRFLATTLRYVMSNILQKQGRRRELEHPVSVPGGDRVSSVLDATATGVVTRAVRQENRGALFRALERLDEGARRIVLLRGFEQLSNEEIGERLNLLPNTVAVKYRRALLNLRELLPGSVFDEFPV